MVATFSKPNSVAFSDVVEIYSSYLVLHFCLCTRIITLYRQSCSDSLVLQ